ncbi:MAG: Response regulator PleD [Phycisphaerae bacterium]|nr:Response regulator PleD [Phycisphaerae bacterium]
MKYRPTDPMEAPIPVAPTLLLLGRNEDRSQTLSDWLTRAGFRCRTARDAEQARPLLQGEPVQALLIDADASDASAELIAALREAPRCDHLPALVHGRKLDAADRGGLLAAGADEALTLDAPNDELTLRVHGLLELRQLRDDLGRARVTLQDSLTRERRALRRLQKKNRRLREMAITDPLTRVYNARYFRQWVGTQFEIARRYNLVLSVLMIDVDHFKNINDKAGHQFGDFVLKQFAGILAHQVRSSDVVARNGGDEFVIGLVETGRQEAIRFGRRLLRAVASHSFEYFGQAESITISIGQAGFPDDQEITTADQLMLFADTALYRAKESGRNDLACWSELDAQTRHRLASPHKSTPAPAVSGEPTLYLTGID